MIACLLVLLSMPTLTASALADGDPASDVLLAQNAFYPYVPPVSQNMEETLSRLLTAAAHEGLPLKVAIIGSTEDLGLEPRFFGHPQAYADFLDREISFNAPVPLLVVMAAGYGVAAVGSPATLAHMSVDVDAHNRTYGLTRSAILAAVAIVRATGRSLAAPSIPPESGAGKGGIPIIALFGVPAILLIGVGVTMLRAGSGSEQERS